MKPQTYSPTQDPNARTQNLINPIASVGGELRKMPTVTNLAEAVAGSFGTLRPRNRMVGNMSIRAASVVDDFKSMTGANNYGIADRAMQATGTAGGNLLQGLSKALARLKVG